MNMRRFFLLTIVCAFSFNINAQRDVTKFLGIPVDGPKNAMIQKLKAKGFTYNQSEDFLSGQFNDHDVEISVVTNNNKVSRIAIFDKYSTDEAGIKIRFNKLCGQFEKNSKYISTHDQTIPDDEDISYKMLVDNKRYQALFYQKPVTYDTLQIRQEVNKRIELKYSKEYIENNPEEVEKESVNIAQDIVIDLLEKTTVWFMIKEIYGKYKIYMFYDNEYNKSDGDDL